MIVISQQKLIELVTRPDMDQGGLTLPTRDYYLSNDTTVMDALKQIMKKVIKLMIRDKQVRSESNVPNKN